MLKMRSLLPLVKPSLRLQAEIDEAKEMWLQDAAPEAVAKEANLFQQRAIALQEQISVIQSIEELDRQLKETFLFSKIRKQEYDLLKPLVEAGHESRLVYAISCHLIWQRCKPNAEGFCKNKCKAAESSTQLVEAQTQLKQARSRQDP